MPEAINPFNLNLSGEQANILLEGIQHVPENKRKNVVYQQLERDLKVIVAIWGKRIKEERAMQIARAANKQIPKPQAPIPPRPQ